MEAIDLDDFEFNEVILRDVVVLDILITYFNEGIFGQTNLKKDIFHHFGTDIERSRVKVARRSDGGSNIELIVDRMIDVSLYMDVFPLTYH